MLPVSILIRKSLASFNLSYSNQKKKGAYKALTNWLL